MGFMNVIEFIANPMNIKALFAALLLAKASAFAAVLDLGSTAGSTPYDPYMSPVKQVLGSLHGSAPDIKQVKALMRTSHNFRYSFTEPYVPQLPSVTATKKSGDCKAKSLWLADQLGDRNVRFVIGKATRSSKMSHAWLMWNDGARWWVLDPTNVSNPIAADRVSSNEYIPLYSYGAGHCYTHAATAVFTGVAGKNSVASNNKASKVGSKR